MLSFIKMAEVSKLLTVIWKSEGKAKGKVVPVLN
jgi:hypothetical protein